MFNRGKIVTGALLAGGLTAVSLVAGATTSHAAGDAAFDQLSEQLNAAAAAEPIGQPATGSVDSGLVDKLSRPSPRALISDPDYWVFNQEYDSAYDSSAYPELGTSALAVSKSAPDLLAIAGLASPVSDGFVSPDGYVSVLIDTNGDSAAEFGTITPATYMALDSAYSAPIYRFVAGSAVSTGLTATWVRTSDAWVTTLPWQSLGISGARYVMALKDSAGDVDYSPNTYGSYSQLVGVVGYTPPAPPAPPAPVQTSQAVLGKVPAKHKAKRNKKISLPGSTNAGTRVRWKSQTPKVCKISGGKLVLTGKKGKCKISATAAASSTRFALSQRYTIKLK